MTAPTLPPRADGDRRSAAPRRRGIGGLVVRGWSTSRRRLANLGDGVRAPWVVGPIAALWAAAMGLAIAVVPMLVIWMATPESGLTWLESIRVGGLLWVVAHGTPIALSGVTYSLLPWGLVVIPMLLLAYAGGWAVRITRPADWRHLAVLVSSGAFSYAIVVGAAALVTSRSGATVAPVVAGLHALVVAALALGFGAVRRSDLDPAAVLPAWARTTVRSGLIAAFALLGVGALASTAALIVRVDDAVTMADSLHAGFWGGLALLALGLGYVPVLAVWSTSYLLGAGVVVGPAVIVSPFIPLTAPTQLPPFPMLAALPQSASPLAWALPVVGVLSGVLAGLAIARRARAEARLMRLGMALGAAAVCGLVLSFLSYLASGALGDQRLASLGPSPLTVGVLAVVLVALGALPSAVVTAPPAKPRLSVADDVVVVVDQEPEGE